MDSGRSRRPFSARLSERLWDLARGLGARFPGEWWLLFSALFVAVGVWLRTRRFFSQTIPLWGDEAHWLIQLLTTSLKAPSIRPVGFMAVSKFLAEKLGPTEVVLRFLPWLCGVLSLLVCVPLARRLFRAPAARLLFVAIIALHLLAIDLSKEFKPYSISLFLHLCALWCAASYWEVGKARWLAAAIGGSFVGVLFAQDVVFLYPALYLVLGIAAWRARRYRHLAVAALGALLTLGLLGLLYHYFWQYVGGPGSAGNKRVSGLVNAWWSPSFDLFYTGKKTAETQQQWLLRKFSEMAAFAGARRDTWSALGPLHGARLEALARIDQAVWTLLQVLGLVCLAWQKRARNLLLLVLPQLVVLCFNVLQLWPLGAFRSDLFLLVYSGGVASAALDYRVGSERAWRQLLPAALLVLAPLLCFERTWHRHKNGGGELLQGVDALVRLQGPSYAGPRELLVLDGYLCVVWRYYQDYHPGYRERFAALRARFRKQCVRPWNQRSLVKAERLLRGRRERFWLLLAREPEMQMFADSIPAGYRLIAREDIEDGQTLAVGLRRR